jgi:hypothetical protein
VRELVWRTFWNVVPRTIPFRRERSRLWMSTSLLTRGWYWENGYDKGRLLDLVENNGASERRVPFVVILGEAGNAQNRSQGWGPADEVEMETPFSAPETVSYSMGGVCCFFS